MNDPAIHIHVTNDGVYMENGLTIYLRENGPCWIIDPGLPPQAEEIIDHVRAKSLTCEAIVLTHAHPDHIAGIDEVREALGEMPVYLAKEEWDMLTDPNANLSALMGRSITANVTDPRDLPHGETIELDGSTWKIFNTAGHSPGGRTFYSEKYGIAIVGDALFAGSVGRVDFPHSNGEELMRNIHENLMTLPGETRVISGHGPDTTIDRERTTNPFVLNGF